MEAGIVRAGIEAAIGFVSQENKPWSYYAGVFAGAAAVATGIPLAAATIYVVGDTLDAQIFKSPDSSDLRVFLNGVQVADLETYAASALWEAIQINLAPDQVNRVDFVNNGVGVQNAGNIAWLAISQLIVNGSGNEQILEAFNMPYDTLNFRFQDSESDASLASVPIYVPQNGLSLAEIQTYSDLIGPEIQAMSDAKCVSVTITLELTLFAGIPANPVAGSLNERGGLISFDTDGPRRDSVRIPAIKHSIMSGNEFSVAGTEAAALIDTLTNEKTAANIQPVTAQDYNFLTAIKGKKSFRK